MDKWVLLYLHSWDPPRPNQKHPWEPWKNVFPEVHAYYDSEEDAQAVLRTMADPGLYSIRKVRKEDPERIRKAKENA